MKILSLSDKIVSFIYSPAIRSRFRNIDLILGCGDLPYYYLEYVYTALEAPLYFVRGNHDKIVEYGVGKQRTYPHGCFDLHGHVLRHNGILLAGVEGSLRYRPGPFQYSQAEMWSHVWRLVPGLLYNRIRYGRYLDFFVTHAPPEGIHDRPDLPHRGIKAFRWFLQVFKPSFCYHGHIHIYRPKDTIFTKYEFTQIMNTYAFKETEVSLSTGEMRVL